jgi:hypothetical protein
MIAAALLALIFAQAVPASPSALQLADARRDASAACQLAVAKPGMDGVPQGFCRCFARTVAPRVAALSPGDRALFLIITEFGGRTGKALKAAETRLQVSPAAFTSAWERLDPIGAAAGAKCAKRR